ncbi:MAG TPA: hypothetical protein VF715_07450 [Thermoleophilaceae bacterium]
MGALASPASAASLPACPAAPCAGDRGPVVVLSYWQSRHYSRLVDAVRRAGLPPTTPVFYGNYWGSGRPSEPKEPGAKPPPRPSMPNGRHAPIFPLAHSVFWRKRKVPARDRRALRHAHADARGGRIPSLRKLSGRGAYRWGRELGRRFRDRIRNKRRGGTKVTTWQFDEVVSEIAEDGRQRALIRGVLDGLHRGRRELGDERLPGIVFATQKAMRTARRGGDFRRLWRAVDRASLYVIGEEYPEFAGSARGAARREERGQRALRRVGGSLARKYVVGMTPGLRLEPGLGGNVGRRSVGAVNGWREAFVRARAARRPAGFAQYHFRFENSPSKVMRATMRSMAKGARLSRR